MLLESMCSPFFLKKQPLHFCQTCLSDLFNKDLSGIFPPQGYHGVPYQKCAHPAAGRLQHAGEGFLRLEAKIEKALFHMIIAGNPDNLDPFARLDST